MSRPRVRRASPIPEIVEVIAATGLRSLINAMALVSGTEIDWPKAPRIPEA